MLEGWISGVSVPFDRPVTKTLVASLKCYLNYIKTN